MNTKSFYFIFEESLNSNDEIITKYNHGLVLIKESIEKNAKVVKLLSETNKKVQKLESEKEHLVL